MTREEWQLIKRIASAALDQPEVTRQAYVTSACRGDQGLEREVRSLLSFTDSAAHRFETAAFEWPAVAAGQLRNAIDHTQGRGGVEAPGRFLPGTIINGRYRVEDVAGTGGMGAVYRVTDLSQPRTLALKTVHGDPRFVNLFKIEFRTLGALRHPHLARSHDFEPIAGSADYCFTMDFVDGGNIFDATEGVRWPEVVDLLVQLCRALAYVHNRGVVHRDIKPNNVLVQPDRTLKLVDFGLAGVLANDGPLLGTPAYVAPELIDRRSGDHRSDLYGLGILIYELLCRRLPVVGSIAFPEGVDAPGWLKEMVLRLCAWEPADRFRGANQVIETINRHSGSSYPVETAATRESYVVSGRFVGRQGELSALSAFVRRRLRAQTATTGSLAFVSGQSGVGKSRLVHELRCELQLDRQVFVEGNCFEGAAAEYGAFAEIIAQLLPRLESADAHTLVERHLPELVKIAPEIGRSRDVGSSPALTTPEAERRRLLDSVAEFLVDASGVFSYVLHVNDLQWAPQGTIEILRYLHRRIDIAERQDHRVRLALVGSYRGDEVTGRPLESLLKESDSGSMTIRLAPLPPESMRRLLSSMFGLEDIPEPFVARVLDEAGGSPFFLEEVVRALVEHGSVFVADGAWSTTRTVGELEIPATVTAALRRRVAMVADPWQLRVLQVLAAYQKPISTSLLAAVTHLSPEDVEQALYQLSGRHMVTAVGRGEPLYRTAHDHLRTAVYVDLAAGAAALHHGIARALEGRSTDGDPPLSELAHHYWLAQDRDEALKYALLAGDSALAVYANDEAIEHLEHALELLPPDKTPVRSRTTEQLADAHFLAGHYARTRSLLVDVSRTAVGTVNAVRVQRKLGEVVGRSAGTPHEAADILWKAARDLGANRPPTRARFLGRSVTALVRHFVQQLFGAGLVEDAAERTRLTELASLYLRIAYFNFFGDPTLFFLPVLRAANLIDRVGEGREHSNVYSLTGIALAGLGFTARADRYGLRAIAEAERSGSQWHIANARSFHAIVLLQMGRWDQAIADAERARTGFAACGDHFELAVTLYQILELLQARGELPAAVARGREELAMFERLGLQMIGKGPFTQFGRALAKTGDVEGLAVGTDVLKRAEHGADKLSTVLAHLGLGDSCLHLGRTADAIDHLERALAIRDRDRFDVYVASEGSALLVQAYTAQIRAGGASYDGDVRRRLDRRVSQAVGAGRRFPPMRSAASLVRGLQCRLRGRRTQATRWFVAAANYAEELGAKVWQADAHFEHGLACLDDEGRTSRQARLELERALALYQASGARPREQRTQQLLSTLAAAWGQADAAASVAEGHTHVY